MTESLITLYERTRRDARRLGTLRLRWAVHRARRALASDRLDQERQVRVVALEQEAMVRGLLHSPSLPQRPDARRRVPPSVMARFRRID